MDNDELVKKLESLDVPDIPVESHRKKLREALLMAVAVKGLQRKATFWDNAISRLNSLSRRFARPAWKFASASLAAVLIILSVLLGFRITGNVSPTVLASSIALSSPELPGLLDGNGEIRVLNVNVTGRTARVICGRDIGSIVEADVDLSTRKVTRTQRLEGFFMPELTGPLKADAINIAMTDPRVKQMVSEGGSVRKVLPSLSSLAGVSMLNDNMLKLIPTPGTAVVQVELNGKSWLIQTNLNGRTVERIIEPQLRTPIPAFWNNAKSF